MSFELTKEFKRNEATDIAYWPWGVVTFLLHGQRHVTNSYNWCSEINTSEYENIEKWSDTANLQLLDSIRQFDRLPMI